MGVDTTSYYYQVGAFAVFPAVWGLFAHYLSYFNPGAFDIMKSVEIGHFWPVRVVADLKIF
jgi:hypothetical protein